MSGRPLAVVTGGARRVGRAIAERLARAGCDVVFTFHSSEDEARGAADAMRAHGVDASAERIDLDDLDATQRLGERWAREWPRLDVLVHSASIYGPTPVLPDSPAIADEGAADASWGVGDALSHYRVNALAPLVLTRALSPLLVRTAVDIAGARPSVVAMCDMHVLGRPRAGFIAYAMSKAALVELVRTLARELAPHVRVNGVAPGVVAFPESGYESDEASQRAYLSRVPLARSGTPADAAEAVRWLALDAAYTTGEIVRVDGGRWLS